MDGWTVLSSLYRESARLVHLFAFRQAAIFDHEKIEPTDLLFGLSHEAKPWFAKLNISQKTLKSIEAACKGKGPRRIHMPSGFWPFDDQARAILFRAAREMLNRRHKELDIEHLLLGLLHVPSPAKNILNEHGLVYEMADRKIPFHPRTELGRGDGLDYT